MKVAIISDTHLGCKQYGLEAREEDFFRAFAYALHKAAENGCEVVLHCGDLFDVQRPPNRVIARTYRLVEEAGVSMIVIPGNHDYAWRGDIPPGVLLDMDGHNVSSSTRVLCASSFVECCDLQDVRVVGIRYLTPSEIRKNWHRIKEEAENLALPDRINILLMHQEWRRISPYPEAGAFDFGDLPEGYDFIFFGHLHTPPVGEKVGKTMVVNVGATENTTYSEASHPKFVWLLDTDSGKLDRLYIPVRPVVFVKCEGDLEVVKQQKRIAPIIVLEKPELEADVLQMPHLKIIRKWERTGSGRIETAKATGSLLEELMKEFGNSPADRIVAEAVEMALLRGDLTKEDVLTVLENAVAKALEEGECS